MQEEAALATPARMGRKPLGMKPTPVRIAPETLERIDALVGTYGRAKFIREAVEEKLSGLTASPPTSR